VNTSFARYPKRAISSPITNAPQSIGETVSV
jgi:hypothetical protein